MPRDLTQLELLTELEPVVAKNLDRHLSTAKDWNPHNYVPADSRRTFAASASVDWDPEQSRLTEVAKIAMITNLLTEDNLPSYHQPIAEHFPLDSAWRTWVRRWTAEENRHAIAMRDYLIVARAVDAGALERDRMVHMTRSGHAPDHFGGVLDQVAYVTVQELATRIRHRSTGRVCGDPIADHMLARIAADENLHMIFYRTLTAAAFDLTPDQTIEAVTNVVKNFTMPGYGMPNWRRNGVLMVKHGIYDLRQHLDEVLTPVLRTWNVFGRTDFTGRGNQSRDELAEYLDKLGRDVICFEEQRAHLLAR
ncbi:acyl-ACP desaturase [Nocardia amamiensis]|uniref:acyl-ACP desaturase n=1 Tax=Nocardia amamiensis TaxID=404578 RepID=UPI00082B9A61|nr:acyl-ACP desaturase [Nocardia amamiensis]